MPTLELGNEAQRGADPAQRNQVGQRLLTHAPGHQVLCPRIKARVACPSPGQSEIAVSWAHAPDRTHDLSPI